MHAPPLVPLLRALLALAVFALLLHGARRIARALLAAPDRASEAAATVTVAGAAVTLGFNVLSALGAFSLPGCAVVIALVALIGRAVDRGDASAPAPRWDPLLAALTGAAGLVAGARWLRASVSPALAPDSMTYHLYRAARWVQRGHDLPEDWPDAAGYYEFFPAGGEVFWGYAFALTGEDLCVASVGIALWAACGVAAYALAREGALSQRRAGLAALAVVSAPAALSVSTSGYVDAWTLATFLLAFAHLRRALVTGCAGSLALTALAAALHLGTKLSGVPAAVALGAAALSVALRGPTRSRDALRRFAIGAALGLAVAGPGLLRATVARGSPLYPMALGGPAGLPGNRQLAALLEGALSPAAPAPDLARVARAFTVGLRGFDADPMGWGIAWLVALPLGALALARARRDRPALALDLLSAALALTGVVAMASPAARELRTNFLPFSPRLVLALPSVLAVLAARVGGPRADGLWAALVLANLALALPPATSPAAREAVVAALPWALGAACVAALAARVSSRGAARAAAVALAAVIALSGVRDARTRHRGAILAAMGGALGARSYEVNPVGGAMTVFWRAGDALARDCARRTAVAFGWSPPGHRSFRYPLMGEGWTNELVYVPVTESGEVVDLADDAALAPRLAPARWYARLIEGRVDHVVTSPPHPRELSWMLARPDLFEPIADEAAPLGVFRVRAVHRCPR